MKIVLDPSRCSSIGICEAAAPDVFEIGADGSLNILIGEIPEDRRGEMEQVCEDCPTQALSIEG
jgi:ferredoxin